ncbi:MAG: uroporphyrinogen-III C-methyltransferase [Chloroherpetonaceae bacterium]|nr:uroporphyrinogen-III C-methyltransferase [Chthonomonadaceae bacterium]MDW8207496.1 uroporphyrinogen-III C-methyltransferase [Chloroherpetonaceae bacterium]
MATRTGTVYLVGAGPGDPGLITVRGIELLRQADAVVYDRLTHPSLLDQVRPDAERVYAGKASAQHILEQADINALLVDRARQGKNVVRLKGGDPFVFGRGGEEAEYCRAHGVPFEIVPGVTSAIAAPAYAGIPVTHRDAASSFAVITGHERHDGRDSGKRLPGTAEQKRDWARIAQAADTLIFLMGVENLPEIVERLQQHGRSPDTPVALIQWGTWPRQRVVTGTLATICTEAQKASLAPPAVCVIGDVVRLRERLRWFDNPAVRPLFGKRVLVTRAREQLSALSNLLRRRGAEPVEFPTIRIERLADYTWLDEALRRLSEYSWVVFTSANTVDVVAERLRSLGLDSRAFGGCKVAAIGPATAAAMERMLNVCADFLPSEAVAEAVLAEWPESDLRDTRILLPRAREARDVLPEGLRQRGAQVDVVMAYETRMERGDAEALRQSLRARELDLLTFTASSTVRNFVQALAEGEGGPVSGIVGNIPIAAIGPVTADTLRQYGLTPAIVAVEHTLPGLVAAVETYFSGQQ